MVGCTKGNGKICVHVTVVCENCGGNHTANSPRCASRHKANVEARKKKKLRQSSEKEKEKARNEIGEKEGERVESLEPYASMDLESEQWTTSPPEERFERFEEESSEIYFDESLNHAKNY